MKYHQWLPECATFNSHLKELDGTPPDQKPARLKFLSQHKLDFIRTDALATKVNEAMSSLPVDCVALCGPTVKIALLSSHTMSHLSGGIAVGALRRGFNAEQFVGQYGLYRTNVC